MSIIVENAKSGVSICRLCDEQMKEGEERLGAALNKRITAYAHPGCFLKSFASEKTPNNRGKCKLGCKKALKKDEIRVGFQFDPDDTIWFHIECCADFIKPAAKYTVTSIAGLDDLDANAQKEVSKHFGSAKSGPRLPAKPKAKPEPVTGSEPKETKKRKTRASSKPIVKAKEDIGEDEEGEDEGDDEASSKSEKKTKDADEDEGGEEDEGDDEGYGENAPDRETDFGCLTSEELREECKKYNIKTWGLSKDKMIKALQADLDKKMPKQENKNEKDWDPAKDGDKDKAGGEDGDKDGDKGDGDNKDGEDEDAKPAKKQKTASKDKAGSKKKKGKK